MRGRRLFLQRRYRTNGDSGTIYHLRFEVVASAVLALLLPGFAGAVVLAFLDRSDFLADIGMFFKIYPLNFVSVRSWTQAGDEC